jgi:hypothetical protein
MPTTHRWIAAAGWLLAALACVLLAGGIARAQSTNQVALVVQYGDGTTYIQCVEFTEPQITGLDVLLRAQVELVYSGGGASALVCKIGPDGCDSPGNCLCQCTGADCEYWSYWHLVDGAWQYAQAGAGLYKVEHGAVEGWGWGIGTPSDAPQPPVVAFEEICVPPTATPLPTATAAPTATATRTTQAVTPPAATAAATPAPTATRTPSPTATATTQAETAEPEASRGPAWGSYAAFGGIVVVLAVVGVVVLRKK